MKKIFVIALLIFFLMGNISYADDELIIGNFGFGLGGEEGEQLIEFEAGLMLSVIMFAFIMIYLFFNLGKFEDIFFKYLRILFFGLCSIIIMIEFKLFVEFARLDALAAGLATNFSNMLVITIGLFTGLIFLSLLFLVKESIELWFGNKKSFKVK